MDYEGGALAFWPRGRRLGKTHGGPFAALKIPWLNPPACFAGMAPLVSLNT
jgi:hypothetical protein